MSEKVFVSNLPLVTAAINAASLKALRAAADQGRNQIVDAIGGKDGEVEEGRTAPGQSPRQYLQLVLAADLAEMP